MRKKKIYKTHMFLLKIEINLKLANVGISKNHHWVCIELIDVYLKKIAVNMLLGKSKYDFIGSKIFYIMHIIN